MGINESKRRDLPDTDLLVKRLEECLVPDDRELILDYLEMLDEKCEKKSEIEIVRDKSGYKIIVSIIRRMLTDSSIVREGFTLINSCKSNLQFIMDFIQHGGIEVLSKAIVIHEKDEFLSVFLPKLLAEVIEMGAETALAQISLELSNLQLCMKCQIILEQNRLKAIHASYQDIKIPKPSDRINRVCMFMENYPKRIDVQVIGLEAFITYTQNGDCESTVLDTNILERCAETLKLYPENEKIVWRVCVVLFNIGGLSAELAKHVSILGIHDVLAENYFKLARECRVQQQVLWLINTLLSCPFGRRKLNGSEKVMSFVKDLHMHHEEDLNAFKFSNEKDRHRPFMVVIPHHIRAFLRETHGLIRADLVNLKNQEKKAEAKKLTRVDYVEKEYIPRYGVVDLEEGVPGLLDDEMPLNKTAYTLVKAKQTEIIVPQNATAKSTKVAAKSTKVFP